MSGGGMTDVERVLYATIDPTVLGENMPAMTTLLYRVCDNDPVKFEEACRIVELFIVSALTFNKPMGAS
jgi:hypothetical protein